MSLARPTGALGRAFKPHRDRLTKDSVAFSRASLAAGAAGAAGRASPQMTRALSRWRKDAKVARIRMKALPRRVRGKAAAVQALQRLEGALELLAHSFSVSDLDQAKAASAGAGQQLKAYHRLVARLERRLR